MQVAGVYPRLELRHRARDGPRPWGEDANRGEIRNPHAPKNCHKSVTTSLPAQAGGQAGPTHAWPVPP